MYTNINLSVVIPCYNEAKTIVDVVNKVNLQTGISFLNKIEIIVVDDGSIDNSVSLLKEINLSNLKIIEHEKNKGKGAALITGFKESTGDIILIQDADKEYNPNDFKKLLSVYTTTEADVVYGSRFLGSSEYTRLHFFYHFLANKILTFICNLFTNLNMTDMETGYKTFKKSFIEKIILKEKSFGIEPELTIKLAKTKAKFFEVAISYNGRSYEEGKKIGLKDAFIAIYCIFKYSLFK